MESHTETGRIKLNLVITYPVRWSRIHVMEDYIQNFYDITGAEKFSRDFNYCYNEKSQTLRMKSNKGFSAEWLQYMGVSTKRESKGNYTAGKFGEGFKIASLCAFRDYKIGIHMESRDWILDVVEIQGKIDGQDVSFLGYDIKTRDYRENSILWLTNITSEAYRDFLEAMKSFFYPENPLFGECIVNEKDYAVYRLKQSAIGEDRKIYGRLFASMQERAQLYNVPLIFCNHKYRPDEEDDRDRRNFLSYDTEKAVMEIVSELEGEALWKVFMAFRPYWNSTGENKSTGIDWSRVIKKMVIKIHVDKLIRRIEHAVLEGDYIADMDYYTIKMDKNKYKTAMAWFRGSSFHGTYKLLPDYFSYLGIDTLYDLCKKNDGFHVIYEPDEFQKNKIQILERVAKNIFGDMICYEKLPECRIIVNREAPNEGFARTFGADRTIKNSLGLRTVAHIKEINLRKELFCRNAFPKAMVVYMHELLHQFGGDASRQFRAAILAMDYRILEEAEKLEDYEREWMETDRMPIGRKACSYLLEEAELMQRMRQ